MYEAEDLIPDFTAPEIKSPEFDPFAADFALEAFELPPELGVSSASAEDAAGESTIASAVEIAASPAPAGAPDSVWPPTDGETFSDIPSFAFDPPETPLDHPMQADAMSDPPAASAIETHSSQTERTDVWDQTVAGDDAASAVETSASETERTDVWDQTVAGSDSDAEDAPEADATAGALGLDSPPPELVPAGLLESLIAGIDRQISVGSRSQRIERRRESLSVSSETDARAKYLSVLVGDARYAVSVDAVAEIGLVPSATPLPKTPPWLRGVANLRGDVIFVVNLRTLFGFPFQEPDPLLTRMLVARNARRERTVGVIVDQVNGFVRISEPDIEKLGSPSDDLASQYVQGVYEQGGYLLSILDLNQLLLSPAMRPFETV
jgi:purine-binding chemotaxis protein CheW